MLTSCTHRALLLLLLAASTGCGATGLAWVEEPQTSARASEPIDLNRPVSPRPETAAMIPATAEQDPGADARPRLSHTVTLGEIDVQSPNAPPAAGPGGVSVTINNYTTVAVPGTGYGYATFGYGRGAGSFYNSGSATRAATPSSSGPQAGQNWPAVADHGSSFPLRSAPAAPFARTQ